MERMVMYAYFVVFLILNLAISINANDLEMDRDGNPKSDLNYEELLQKVPPIKETAEKFHRYFLGGSSKAVHPLWYTRNSNDRRIKRDPTKDYDVAFLIDASGSIKESEFYQTLKALDMLVTKAKETTKYALITFSEEAVVVSIFKWPPWKIRGILNTTEYQGFRTNTQDALMKCYRDLFYEWSSRVRRRSYKSVLVITDGLSNIKSELTLYRAAKLKRINVEVFVVAIGKYIKGINEVVGMATSKEFHLFRVESVEGLIEVVQMIPPTLPRRP